MKKKVEKTEIEKRLKNYILNSVMIRNYEIELCVAESKGYSDEKIKKIKEKKDILKAENDILDNAISILSYPEKKIIKKLYIDKDKIGMNYIAEELGISYVWAMKLKKRALEKIDKIVNSKL